MSQAQALPGWPVLASLLLALILTVMPMPALLAAARPAWVILVLSVWLVIAPRRAGGVIMAWCCGLLMDVLTGTVLGEHALALAVACFCVAKLQELLRTFPLWQQSLALVPVFVVYEFILFWIDGATGRSVDPLWRWLPVISTALLWPLGHVALTYLDRV